MGATLSGQLALYMEHYHDNIEEIFFTSEKTTSPVLAGLQSKSEDDGMGRGFVVPVVSNLPGNVRPTFSGAQTKSRATTTGHTFASERWVIQPVESWGVANFSGPAVRGAKGDSDKLLDIIKLSMETETTAMRNRLAHYVTGAGWGKIGTVLAVTSTTITIDPALCNLVQEGDDIAGAASESGAVFRAITGGPETTITAIARDTGVLTVDQDPTAGTAIAVGDILFRFEDRENSATPSRLVVAGLDAWFGSNTTLFGVTIANSANLKAHQISGAGKDDSQTIVEAIRTLFSYGSRASVCYTSPVDFERISLDRDSVKTVSMEVGKYKVGFEGLMASWQGYSCPILPDAMIQPGNAYLGPFDDERYAPFLIHNGDLINVADEDGQELRAVDGSDAYETRLYFRGNIACPAPGKFARITGLGT